MEVWTIYPSTLLIIALGKTFGDSNYFLTFAPLVPAKPLIDAQMRGAFFFIDIQIWPNDIL